MPTISPFARPFSKPASLPPQLAQKLPPAPKQATAWAASPAARATVKDSFTAARPSAPPVVLQPPLQRTATAGAAPAPARKPQTVDPSAPASAAQPMKQTHRIEGTKIYAETQARLPASARQVQEHLQGDWSQWWQHSDVKNLQRTADGGTQFDFKPLSIKGQGPTQLNVKISPGKTEKLPNGNTRITLPVELRGDFNGRARFELEQSGNETTLKSIWEGVEPAGWKKHLPDLVAGMHMRVEAGNVPGAKNTGFAGLIDRVNQQNTAALPADQRFKQELSSQATTLERMQASWSDRRALSQGDGIRSRNHVLPNGKVNSRTEVDLNATSDKVQTALQGSWDQWWGHSKIENRSADGSSFTIKPLGTGPAVNIKMDPPVTTVGADGLKRVRINAHFSGDFTGRGYIDLKELPGGKTNLSFNWPEFEVTGALKSLPGVAIAAHTLALEGDVPGKNGTGLEGLVNYLKGQR